MHEKSGLCFVMVTHDLHEAFTLGTKVAIMNQGKIEQYDTPENIQNNPASEWIENFLRI